MVNDFTPEAGRNEARMSSFMAIEWLAAYERVPELFLELGENVGLPASGERLPKHDAAVLAFFRRKLGSDVAIASVLFNVDERHFAAFRMDSVVDFAKMLAYVGVPIEMVEDLHAAKGEPLTAPWPTTRNVVRYHTVNAPSSPDARRLVRYVTKSDKGYALMRAGVPARSVMALEGDAGHASREEMYELVTEASFLGVPVTYAVPAVLGGARNVDMVMAGYKNGVTPEYLSAMLP
jgi:hypothetical protein